MNLILFGPPGSGKGTQSAHLVQNFGMRQISTGDLFRVAMREQTEIGKKAKTFIDRGALVPDTIVYDLLKEAFQSNAQNFILDGFPRNLEQAAMLDQILEDLNAQIDKVVFLKVETEELVHRLAGRRVCKTCGAVYHVETRPPKINAKCDQCGGEVIKRQDDAEDVVRSRLDVYSAYTSPLRDYYRKIGKYVEVNGDRGVDQVFDEIRKAIVA